MATRSDAPKAGGEVQNKWYGPHMEAFQVSERVTITADTSSASLTQALPANARILWSQLRNNADVSVASGTSDSDQAPTGVALIAGTIATGGVTSSSALVIFNSTADDTLATDAAFGYTLNETTSEVDLALIPARSAVDTTATDYYYINTTPTNGMHFDAAGDVSVTVCGVAFPSIESV